MGIFFLCAKKYLQFSVNIISEANNLKLRIWHGNPDGAWLILYYVAGAINTTLD